MNESRMKMEFEAGKEAERVLAGKYQILQELSRGGQGRILLVQDLHLPKKWAVKVMRKEGTRLYREAALLGGRKHPGLPSAVVFLEGEAYCYLIMEYVEGRTLRETVLQDGCLGERECVDLMRQTADILGYLHSLRPAVWHLDIKPANLLLTADKKVVLVDFGAAMESEETAHPQAACYGTYGYAPPEQCRGGKERKLCDARSDIYALGATVYFCLTGFDPGKPPFGIRPCGEWENTAGTDLIEILKRCTEKEPDKRFQTIWELQDKLAACRTGKRKKALGRWISGFLPGKRKFVLCVEKSVFCTSKESPGLIDSLSEE